MAFESAEQFEMEARVRGRRLPETLDEKLVVHRRQREYARLRKRLRLAVFNHDDVYEQRIARIITRITNEKLNACQHCGRDDGHGTE